MLRTRRFFPVSSAVIFLFHKPEYSITCKFSAIHADSDVVDGFLWADERFMNLWRYFPFLSFKLSVIFTERHGLRINTAVVYP